jgi:hypothetical protein
MDELDIEEELFKIQSIHESFDEHNPTTYIIMLQANREKLNEGQIAYLEMMAKKQAKRQIKIFDKWREKMGTTYPLFIEEENK